MQQFVELMEGWQVFYATLAAACATLIGLLFIALTFHPSFFRDNRNKWQLRIARKTFGDLLLVLLTSLMFLVRSCLRLGSPWRCLPWVPPGQLGT